MHEVVEYIKKLREEESLGWQAIAARLNEEGVKTAKGNEWRRENVYRQYMHWVKGVK